MHENTFTNTFGEISPKKENRESKKSVTMSRRDFLKRGLEISIGVAATTYGISAIKQKNTNALSPENRTTPHNTKKRENYYTPTKPQEKINQDDIDIIGKTFAQQIETQNQISLDAPTRKAIYEYWHRKYIPDGENYKDGLIAGLHRMQPWVKEIKEIFAQHNIPEEFVYLAIPESHFDMDAISPKQAVGPYQITKNTAQLPKFNLAITDNYDERYDPIKSAELCAKHLQYGFETFGHDWQLALMDYNGGLVNDYIEHVHEMEKTAETIPRYTESLQKTLSHLAIKYNTSVTLIKRANHISDNDVRKLQPGAEIIIPQERIITFKDFNKWLENHINNIISRESQKKYYTVKHGDTISHIAQRFSMSAAMLKSLNNLTTDDISIGQKLHIPTLAQKQKENNLTLLSDFRENINYPEKFYAVIDIIKNEGLTSLFDNATKNYSEIPIPKVKRANFSYTFNNGDTISKMITHLKKEYPQCAISRTTLAQMIIRKNKISNVRNIRSGQTLSITFPLEHPATLTIIASNYNIHINTLQLLNPAIRNVDANLPKDITIRLPK